MLLLNQNNLYFNNNPLLVVSCFSSCIPFVATILIDVECMMISTAMLLTKLLAQKQKRDQDATLALLSISNYVALSPLQSQNIEGVMQKQRRTFTTKTPRVKLFSPQLRYFVLFLQVTPIYSRSLERKNLQASCL